MSNDIDMRAAVDDWYMNMTELVAERVSRERAIKALDAEIRQMLMAAPLDDANDAHRCT
jgi:hypothetical protein